MYLFIRSQEMTGSLPSIRADRTHHVNRKAVRPDFGNDEQITMFLGRERRQYRTPG